MVKFRICILLGFSLLPNSQKKSRKEGKVRGKKVAKIPKKEKEKVGGKKEKNSKKKETTKPEEIKPKYLIEVNTPIGFYHIEYELIPERPKYQIDVICWGTIAKVFSADGDIILKTYIKREIAWIPICVKHVLNPLQDVKHYKLHSHVVNYTISTNKNKLGNRAKFENAQAFFIREEDVDSPQKFTQAYNTDPNLEKCEDEKDKRIRELEEYNRNIIWECVDAPGTHCYDEIVNRLEFLSNPLHGFQVNKIIDQVSSGKKVECKDFVPVCPPPLQEEAIKKVVVTPKKKGKVKNNDSKPSKSEKRNTESKKSKKESKKGKKEKKEKTSDTFKIAIPGEVFYTDPDLSIYDLKETSRELTHAFVLTTVEHLLTRLQKYSLNPLIIKIKKLSNLPVHVLDEQRYETIYARYNVPYVAQCSTIEKPLAKTIKFNEAHCHFTSIVPKLKLLEFMQTQRLYVEICGVRKEIEKPPAPNLFGTEEIDINKKLTPRQCLEKLKSKTEPGIVTLAVACYDLSSLIVPTWDFLEKASCHHPNNMLSQNANSMYKNLKFIDGITINEVNLGLEFIPKSLTPLSENLLSDFDTSLKVEIYLSAPHNAFLEVHTFSEIYRRLFLIVNFEEIAITLLNEIILFNQGVLGPNTIIANYLKCGTGTTQQSGPIPTVQSQKSISSACSGDAITGFMIDNGGGTYAFFLEGVANGIIRDIWGQFMDLHQSIVKTFFNSDFCFEKRLYNEFLKFGGMYTIHLKIPLDKILKQEDFYLEGNVPIPCWQALKKLNLLLKCESLRSMNQYCLFPTPIELMSLDFEYGAPLRWKEEKSRSLVSDEHHSADVLSRDRTLSKRISTESIAASDIFNMHLLCEIANTTSSKKCHHD